MLYSLSPLRIVRYFYHERDRCLLFGSMAKDEKRWRGIYVPPYDHSPVTRAILQGGYEWEQQVIEERIAGKVHIAPGSGDQRVTERTFEVRDGLSHLAEMKSGEYLYQATLKAPPSFYEDYNLNPNEVSFGQRRPDLIQRLPGRKRAFRVIDVKASDALAPQLQVRSERVFRTLPGRGQEYPERVPGSASDYRR